MWFNSAFKVLITSCSFILEIFSTANQHYFQRNDELKQIRSQTLNNEPKMSKKPLKICQHTLIKTLTLEHGTSSWISLRRLLHYLSGDIRVPARGQLDRMGKVCTSDITVGLHPRSPYHSAWQPSAGVSLTLRPSHLSHVTTATT